MRINELLATLASPEPALAACATSPADFLPPSSSYTITFAPSPSAAYDACASTAGFLATSQDAFAAPVVSGEELKLLLAYLENPNDNVDALAGSANRSLDPRHAGEAAIIASAPVTLSTFDSTPRRAPLPASLKRLLSPSPAPAPAASPARALARTAALNHPTRVAPATRTTVGLLDRLADAPQRKSGPQRNIAPGATASTSNLSPTPASGSSQVCSPRKRGRINDGGDDDDEQPRRAVKIVKVVSPSSLGGGRSSQAQPTPTKRARAYPPQPKKEFGTSNPYDSSSLYKSPTESAKKRVRAAKPKRAAPTPTPMSAPTKATASRSVVHAHAYREPALALDTAAPVSHLLTASTASTATLAAQQDFDAAALLAILDACPVSTSAQPLASPSSPIPMQAPVAPASPDEHSISPLALTTSSSGSCSHDSSRSSSLGSAASFWSAMSASSGSSAPSSEYNSPPLPLFAAEGPCATSYAYEGYSLGASADPQLSSFQLGEPLGHRLALEEQPATLGAPFVLADIPVGSPADYGYPARSLSPGIYPSYYRCA
ncbi:hypothetical protein JCM9279_000882 [Rhodotorula babjevae]